MEPEPLCPESQALDLGWFSRHHRARGRASELPAYLRKQGPVSRQAWGPCCMTFKCIKPLRFCTKRGGQAEGMGRAVHKCSLQPTEVGCSPLDLLLPGHPEPLSAPSLACVSVDTEHPHVDRDLARVCMVCPRLDWDSGRETEGRGLVQTMNSEASDLRSCLLPPGPTRGPLQGKCP